MAKSDPNSAEAINTKLRGGISSGFDSGPVQTSYSGMSQNTKDSLLNLVDSTNNSNRGILNDAYHANKDIMTAGGLTGEQRGAMGGFQGIVDQGGLSAPQTESMDYFRGVMQGGEDDPAFQRLRQNAIDDTRTAVNRQFGASGRFGAGSHVRDLGEGIADAAAGMDYRNLQRQDSAAQGLFGMGQTGQSNVSGALGNIFGMGQTGQANTFAAVDRAPGQYENMLLPYQTQAQAYGLLDADNRARAAFDPQYEHLLKYQGLLGNNAAGPQPAKKPGFMDYAGLGLGLFSSFA